MGVIDESGGKKAYSVVVGILVVVAIFFALKYYQDRSDDVTIHLPKVEVH